MLHGAFDVDSRKRIGHARSQCRGPLPHVCPASHTKSTALEPTGTGACEASVAVVGPLQPSLLHPINMNSKVGLQADHECAYRKMGRSLSTVPDLDRAGHGS